MRKVDAALASFNVEQQAYYSGTFVGKHIHRTLKVKTQYINLREPFVIVIGGKSNNTM